MTEPVQKPGRSKQDYGTPPAFLAAVRSLLNIDAFVFDFATDGANSVAENYFLDGALDEDWSAQLPDKAWGWLNPPYAKIGPWVKKAYETSKEGGHIAVLVPAAVGANWWREWVNQKADVLFLNGRLTFVGCTDPFPKDCALLLYHPTAYAVQGSYDVWNWRAEPSRTVDAVDPVAGITEDCPRAPDCLSLFAEESS